MVVAGQQQPLDVLRVAGTDADAAGIARTRARRRARRLRRRRRPPASPATAASACTSLDLWRSAHASPRSSMAPRMSSTVCVRSPHSSCSITAGRAPGARSTGPCAAVPDRTDTTDEAAASRRRVVAAGLANAGLPSSDTSLNATPTMASTIVKCTTCGCRAAHVSSPSLERADRSDLMVADGQWCGRRGHDDEDVDDIELVVADEPLRFGRVVASRDCAPSDSRSAGSAARPRR